MDNGERKIIHCLVKGGERDEIMGFESMGNCWDIFGAKEDEAERKP